MLPDTIQELKTERERLSRELDEMEAIYGDHFPEPSAQLDQWNKIYDRYWRVVNKINSLENGV